MPEEERTDMLKDIFIDGLHNNEIKRQLMISPFESMESTLVLARRLLSADQSCESQRYGSSVDQINIVRDGGAEKNKNIEKVVDDILSQKLKDMKFKSGRTIRCFKCNKLGHISRYCRFTHYSF
ncbi:hypothetical protein RF11_11483 [Thelohanellus kitauei]|uniref:CCHC-type domain-containing protein n=1 Tax=Thelohanellus kitauei TaxID=669202 RepID=A0A0C2MWH8_THEKT|nr:hypothetical protein RF11_11483 [Thelohanellus kitauei]